MEERKCDKLLATQVLSEANELPMITVPRIPEQEARQDGNRTVVLAEANTETNAISEASLAPHPDRSMARMNPASRNVEASQAHSNQITRLNPVTNVVAQGQRTYRSLISTTATNTAAIRSNTTNEDQLLRNGAVRGMMQLAAPIDACEEGTASL